MYSYRCSIIKKFDALLENAELVIQLAWEVQDPGLINQKTAELHERVSAYRTALAQITDQGSEMVSLSQGVLEKPKSFTDVIDTDTVNAFIFQLEQYFAPSNMVDTN